MSRLDFEKEAEAPVRTNHGNINKFLGHLVHHLNINETHDPALRSWVATANESGTDFPIQNLPFAMYKDGEHLSVGVAIGRFVLRLSVAIENGLVAVDEATSKAAKSRLGLNELMALKPEKLSALRKGISGFLKLNAQDEQWIRLHTEKYLLPVEALSLALPARIGGYTDFLTSRYHTERNGRLKGLQDPLPPAFKSLPVAYHGRTSSIRVSQTDVTRPHGQFKNAAGEIRFGPSRALDFELELAAFVGQGNELAMPISINDAATHIFGYCLLNDWSAKDVQWLEQVLGPFLGKNFMSSISPWVVTAEALAPFRLAATKREVNDPPILPHLYSAADQESGVPDIQMEAWLSTPAMKAKDERVRLSKTSPKHLYWTFAQMLAHHTSNGCNLSPGDLIGSGTVSGPEAETMACMTEMTEAGNKPLLLPNGESRGWLEDGDEIVLKARAEREGFVSIGFGTCTGRILPAIGFF